MYTVYGSFRFDPPYPNPTQSSMCTIPNMCYRFLVPFVKVMQKLHKEHIMSSSSSTAEANCKFITTIGFHFVLVCASLSSFLLFVAISELLQLSLDLSKLRVSMMPQECRKVYFNILTSLIEKSSDSKLLKILTRIIDDWIRNRVYIHT